MTRPVRRAGDLTVHVQDSLRGGDNRHQGFPRWTRPGAANSSAPVRTGGTAVCRLSQSCHVSRHLGADDARQARAGDGRLRPHASPTPSSTTAACGWPTGCGPPACGPATSSRCSATTPPRPTRSTGRRCARGSTSPRSTTTSAPTRRPTSCATAAPRRSWSRRPRPTWSRRSTSTSPSGSPSAATCRLRRLRGRARRRRRRAAARAAARRRPALLLGHHRPPQGHQAAAARLRRRRAGLQVRRDLRRALRLRRRDRLPLAGAGLPRGAAALRRRHPRPRRHAGDDGEVRRRRRSCGRCSEHRRDPHPDGADDVRAAAQARRRRAASYDVSSLRCVVHAAAPCPVEVKRRMIEWLGPIVQRVLRLHRGQRRHHDQQRAVARPPRLGRACR